MAVGCFGDSEFRVLCICEKDLCNSNSQRITHIQPNSDLFSRNISCTDMNTTGMCDSPTCMYNNDTSRLYPNSLFLDQTGKYLSNKSNNYVAIPTISYLAFCTLKKCVEHYASERNYSSEYKDVGCYIHSGDNFNENDVCYGQMCYVNNFNGTTTRGCFDYIYDVLWERGEGQHFGSMISNRNNEIFTIHKFNLLEFYVCNYDFCNRDSVSAKANNLSDFFKLFTALMLTVFTGLIQ
ncbi:hypothetical protein PRIPAC_88113 [Pristionchus pacificus]|uniref:Uncharacterized protein n=1 Tax=Pristionchus pacificus TaxID=54126 RepID=A0A2A6CW09_PRIPA|nr:hypothetical protein PRIPAC_88113 [Pristionchus pacificus]|eukprot:PDM82318.1 hypothetical protein PRIPAC_36711 [Pristionchus pacificus]